MGLEEKLLELFIKIKRRRMENSSGGSVGEKVKKKSGEERARD